MYKTDIMALNELYMLVVKMGKYRQLYTLH